MPGRGGSELSTNVNLGGGSTWRGTVPTGPVPRLPDGTVGLPRGESIPILPAAKAKIAARGPLDNT
jgi:hypothetical protein